MRRSSRRQAEDRRRWRTPTAAKKPILYRTATSFIRRDVRTSSASCSVSTARPATGVQAETHPPEMTFQNEMVHGRPRVLAGSPRAERADHGRDELRQVVACRAALRAADPSRPQPVRHRSGGRLSNAQCAAGRQGAGWRIRSAHAARGGDRPVVHGAQGQVRVHPFSVAGSQ